MQRLFTTIISLIAAITMSAQGWPQNYPGVMLQGFYWDSYEDSRWSTLEEQASDLAASFDLIWIPQSGNCGGKSMGYDDLYWFNNYNSSFGSESELRSMIKTFKEKGLGTIADVVINHRKNKSNWVDFPTETYKGTTYTMGAADICANDDNGATKTWATSNGYTLSSNNDTGEGWDGMRDLDHKSENVQKTVMAYLDFLLNDLGYAGFRYDMVKGYGASYTGQYNASASPEFSVGEYWDGNASTVKSWINRTKTNNKIQSAAFDFPFRYTVRNALRGSNNDNNTKNWNQDADYKLLADNSLASDADYRRYAVTFVENHDTEYRSDKAQQDPIRKDTLAANAFLLAMPGTPCVFMKHWQAYKQEISAMIAARKLAGITNTSTYTNYLSSAKTYANIIKKNNEDRLLVAVGNVSSIGTNPNQWVKILSGYHYAYFLSKDLETAWADKGSGDFSEAFDVTLTAVSKTASASLVYTTDGSEPTATNGNQVVSGTSIKIDATTTLKVGLLLNGSVSGIIARTYNYKKPLELQKAVCSFKEGEICAFFEAPSDWTHTIHCWAWVDSPGENFTSANGGWPGVACELLGVSDNGNKVWKWTWDGTKESNTAAKQPAKIIFSNSGSPQTDDLPFQLGGYYNKNGLVKTIEAGVLTGDANGDSEISASDIIEVINYMIGKQSDKFNFDNADVNKDGKVDVADVVLITKMIF